MTFKTSQIDSEKTIRLNLEDTQGFILKRFEEVMQSAKMQDLVHFHTINKYLLMAHDQNQLKNLGRLVANHESLEIEQILRRYYPQLRSTLSKIPTMKSHTNVLYHIMSHFSKDLSYDEKLAFLQYIKKFRDEQIHLSEFLFQIKIWTKKYDNRYLIRQTYFLLFS